MYNNNLTKIMITFNLYMTPHKVMKNILTLKLLGKSF